MKKRRKYKHSSINGTIETESFLEHAFLKAWLKEHPNNPPITQHMFFPTRKWRFDFFWQRERIAVEIQGYGPGHCSRMGMKNDANKNNAAISLGYNTLYFTSYHLDPMRIKATIKYTAYILKMRNKSHDL